MLFIKKIYIDNSLATAAIQLSRLALENLASHLIELKGVGKMKKNLKNLFNSHSKKPLLIIAAVIACSAILCLPMASLATEYLSDSDPIITLSYLKQVFAPEMKKDIVETVAANSSQASELEAYTYVGYTVLEMKKDELLTSANGTVELILRPGSSAVVVSSIPENGLSDITAATEILDGDEVGINHSLIIPRNDGRGIRITSDIAYVLVRGDYTAE